MKKINIIQKTEDFDRIIKERHSYSNRFFVIYISQKKAQYHRFGISIPKKVGNSVLRNRIKRQIKSIIDENNSYNNNLDYVIIVRKDIIGLNYDEKKDNLKSLFLKINGECQSEKI